MKRDSEMETNIFNDKVLYIKEEVKYKGIISCIKVTELKN
jgi:hypothetical protein